MSGSTLSARSRMDRLQNAIEEAARRLHDAVTEFDAALDEGCPMFTLVKLDQEVALADRRHRAALAALPRSA